MTQKLNHVQYINRHTTYNILGFCIPMIAGFICIPILIKELGDAKFGALTLIWAVVGYFGLFDLGIGRSLTHVMAVSLARNETDRLGPIIGSALVLIATLGMFAGALLALSSSWVVREFVDISENNEILKSLLLMAIAMPFLTLTSGLRGVLEATTSFGIINAIRVPMGVFTFIAPTLVVYLGTKRLDTIALTLVFGRIISCLLHAHYAKAVLPKDCWPLSFNFNAIRPLLSFGGWMTLSNVVSPFMGYIDRFIIAAMISAASVAFYVTPQEIVTKIWIIPAALTAVLFPAFSADISSDGSNTKAYFKKSVMWVYQLVFPIALFLSLFSFEILSLWVGPEFSENSAEVMKIFSMGILINCLSHVPYTFIQGKGHAKLTAIVHCIELPFFLAALWLLIILFGLVGAAFAWLFRMLLDSLLLFFVCNKLDNNLVKHVISSSFSLYVILTVIAFLGSYIDELSIRILWYSVIILILLWMSIRESKGRDRSDCYF